MTDIAANCGFKVFRSTPRVVAICDEKKKRFQALHHLFTAPKEEDIAKLDTDPVAVYSRPMIWC